MRRLINLLILAFVTNTNAQSNVRYHQFVETASTYEIIKWNISTDSLPYSYVKETSDNEGRVIEMKFYKNNSTEFVTLCELRPWLKYEYPNDSTIILYALGGDGKKEDGLECRVPYKAIFHLNAKKLIILKAEYEYCIDTSLWIKQGWTVDSLNKAVLEIKAEEKTSSSPFIGGYENSFAKLNGKFPTSKDFNINDFYFSELEKKEIEKALRRK